MSEHSGPPGDPLIMRSARRSPANREKNSTGPKTAEGKARASRNALRHGLSAARVADALASSEAARMADTFGFKT
jgi:hypothetical protein